VTRGAAAQLLPHPRMTGARLRADATARDRAALEHPLLRQTLDEMMIEVLRRAKFAGRSA